jgi:hypothetical protein
MILDDVIRMHEGFNTTSQARLHQGLRGVDHGDTLDRVRDT